MNKTEKYIPVNPTDFDPELVGGIWDLPMNIDDEMEELDGNEMEELHQQNSWKTHKKDVAFIILENGDHYITVRSILNDHKNALFEYPDCNVSIDGVLHRYIHTIGRLVPVTPDNVSFSDRLALLVNPHEFFTNKNIVIIGNQDSENESDSKDVPKPSDDSIKLSIEGLNLITVDPPLFKSIFIDKTIPYKMGQEEIEDDLLFSSIFQPDKLQEDYVIIEREPIDEAMKDYLTILSTSISEQMNLNDEIDDIEELEKNAYDKVKFYNSFEYVKEKATEYKDYFKYLLLKDERHCLTKDKYESLIEIGNILKKRKDLEIYTNSKSFGIKTTIKKLSFKVKEPGIELVGTPDMVLINGSKQLFVTIIKRISENLEDFPKLIDKLNLNMKMAMYSELAIANNNINIEKSTIKHNFIVVDKNNLCYSFEVKAATITKWKKQLYESVNKALWHISNQCFELPYEFSKNGISI